MNVILLRYRQKYGMKLSILGEAERPGYGSLGALTQDRAIVGTRGYLSPEMIKQAFKSIPRKPSKLGKKTLPKFKGIEADWTGDPETMVYTVLKDHMFDELTWSAIWKRVNAELLKYKKVDSRFETPSHNAVKDGLKRLVKRGVVEVVRGPKPQYRLSVEGLSSVSNR
jgi:hypothetical protein